MFNSKHKDRLRRVENQLSSVIDYIDGPPWSMGARHKINYLEKRQSEIDRKLNMLMDYLGVEEKHEPERHYTGRRDDD